MTKAMYIGIPNNPTVTLPSGYTQLEYIESTGTQYIDTGFKPSGNKLQIIIKFRYTAEHNSLSLFGNHTSTPYCLTVYGSRPQFYVGSSSSGIDCGLQTELGVDYTLDVTVNNGTLTAVWNGVTYTATYSGSLYTSLNYFIFGSNTNGSLAEYGNGYRLYYIQFYDNGSMVRNYVPAKNASGTIGLYDIANNKFYTNAGSGTFKAGSALDGKSVARKVNKMYVGVANKPTANLPSGYTQVEYIESSGTQYIDTGFKLSNKSRIVMDMYVTDYSTNTYGNSFFGARDSSNANSFLLLCSRDSNEKWTFMYGDGSATGTITRIGRHTIDVSAGVCNVDGTEIVGTDSEFSCTYNCFLFADNKGGTANSVNNSRIKMYSCQIYDNGKIVRNFIPARNGSGTFGLYDTVNNAFYTNSGSGVFVAGKTLDGKSVARKVKKAYIGVNGIARVFFGGKELKYKGTDSIGLRNAVSGLAGATASSEFGDAAIFAGGQYASGYVGNALAFYMYNGSSLTNDTINPLSVVRSDLASATVGGIAIFAGGYNGSYKNTVDAYTNLTRTTPTALSTARANLAGASVGNYALFAGGDVSGSARTNVVEAYNSNLTKSSATALTTVSTNLAGVSTTNYAIFAGGNDGSTYRSSVDAYNSSLTRTTAQTGLSVARRDLAGATVGDYALFAGGYSGSYYSTYVDVYDKSLTKVDVIHLSIGKRSLTATTLNDYAIFAGGQISGDTDVADVFDTSLTMSTITGLSKARYGLASATIGNYALFAGGYGSDGYYSTVDVYEYA